MNGFRRWLCLGVVLTALPAAAGRLHRERWYQGRWCAQRGGHTEVALVDGTRADCVTDTHSVEFDFADKWAEALGQSLHYARLTGLRAGVVLILENEDDRRFLERITADILHYGLPIDTWTMGPGG